MLRKAQKKLVTQAQAASELGIRTRQIRRLLRSLKAEGDKDSPLSGRLGLTSEYSDPYSNYWL